MTVITKKLVVDDEGNPQEVIIPWAQFLEIEEALGLDLSEEAIAELEIARKDRENGNDEAYVSLAEV